MEARLDAGASTVLIPKQPFDIEAVCEHVKERFETQYAPIIVVSEAPAQGRRRHDARFR